MTDVDKSAIKAGDMVRATYCSAVMQGAGIGPAPLGEDGWAEVYSLTDPNELCVAGHSLRTEALTILEVDHSKPAWDGALVVEDEAGDPWAYVGGRYVCLVETISTRSAEELEPEFEPITIVIDSEGVNQSLAAVAKRLRTREDSPWVEILAEIDSLKILADEMPPQSEHFLTQEELENLPIGKNVRTSNFVYFVKTDNVDYPWKNQDSRCHHSSKSIAKQNVKLIEGE